MASFSQQPDFDEYVRIFLIKIKKNEIILYKQDADKKTKENVLKAIIESMEKSTFSNREIKPYDPVTTYKNVHEQVEVSEYENIQSVISKFNYEQKHGRSTRFETEKDLHNYLVEIKKDSVINLKFIGSFVNAFQLEKKMLIGNFTNSRIKLRERNNLFGLNKKIDLMIVNDEKILGTIYLFTLTTKWSASENIQKGDFLSEIVFHYFNSSYSNNLLSSSFS